MAERKMIPIRIPARLLKEIDQYVGPRRRSQFIVEASERELLRRKQLEAIQAAAGAWKDEDHPELPDSVEGLQEYLRQIRAGRGDAP